LRARSCFGTSQGSTTARLTLSVAGKERSWRLSAKLVERAGTHHDADGQNVGYGIGSRVFTAFIYLSDVEQGGETEFPDLSPPLRVRPERGAMLLWPSVLDGDPTVVDKRTRHAALPVTRGVKLSANLWVWLGPYAPAHQVNCVRSPLPAAAEPEVVEDEGLKAELR